MNGMKITAPSSSSFSWGRGRVKKEKGEEDEQAVLFFGGYLQDA